MCACVADSLVCKATLRQYKLNQQETPDAPCAIKPSNGSADNRVTIKIIKHKMTYFKTSNMTTNVTNVTV